jgi:glycerol dehydrogenase
MLTIKSPETYINEFDIVRGAGKYISAYGKNAYIIAGKTAWEKTEEKLSESLKEWHIEHKLQIMEGYPTYQKVEMYASAAYQFQADVVLGIGGGKACDVAKAVGNFRNIPVVTIPTVAATCACWAARSVLYTEEGNFDFIQRNRFSPKLILADTRILLEAPKRYLAAGIMDTLAKWYEFEPLVAKNQEDVVLRQDVAISNLAFQILDELGAKVRNNTATDEEGKQVIDAILFLAGATGSFANGNAYRGLAHPYYFVSTRIPESRYLLHGEKVAFGLLVQFILAKKEEGFIEGYLKRLTEYEICGSPLEWHTEDVNKTIHIMAELLLTEWPVVREKGFVHSAEEAEQAMQKACELLKKIFQKT